MTTTAFISPETQRPTRPSTWSSMAASAAPGAPKINAELTFQLRAQAGFAPRYSVSGDHDGFPAYELYVNANRNYEHDPEARGQSPLSLFPPMEWDFQIPLQSLPAARSLSLSPMAQANATLEPQFASVSNPASENLSFSLVDESVSPVQSAANQPL